SRGLYDLLGMVVTAYDNRSRQRAMANDKSKETWEVFLQGDSTIVIDAANGRSEMSAAKQELRMYQRQNMARLKELRKKGVKVEVSWVAREQNVVADGLSNTAMDGVTGKEEEFCEACRMGWGKGPTWVDEMGGEGAVWNSKPIQEVEREENKARRAKHQDAKFRANKEDTLWRFPEFEDVGYSTTGEAEARWLDIPKDNLPLCMKMVPYAFINQTKLSVCRKGVKKTGLRWQGANGDLLRPLKNAMQVKTDREKEGKEMTTEEASNLEQLLKAFSAMHLLIYRMELSQSKIEALSGGRGGGELWGGGRDSVKARLELWEKKDYKTLVRRFIQASLQAFVLDGEKNRGGGGGMSNGKNLEESFMMSRARELMEEGQTSRAVNLLKGGKGFLVREPEVAKVVVEKTGGERRKSLKRPKRDEDLGRLTVDVVKTYGAILPHSGCGPDGLPGELLRAIVRPVTVTGERGERAKQGTAVHMAVAEAFVNGDLPPAFYRAQATVRIVPIGKSRDAGPADTRSLALQSMLRRMWVKDVARQYAHIVKPHLWPLQMAVGVQGGVQVLAMLALLAHEQEGQEGQEGCMLALDASNAYNACSRDALLEHVT
ncbi:hypothetical protein TrRE_jg10412, partial [Triparma retinervis]